MHRNAIMPFAFGEGRHALKEEVIVNGKIWIKFSANLLPLLRSPPVFSNKFKYAFFSSNVTNKTVSFTVNQSNILIWVTRHTVCVHHVNAILNLGSFITNESIVCRSWSNKIHTVAIDMYSSMYICTALERERSNTKKKYAWIRSALC